jgi:hypothetical protein
MDHDLSGSDSARDGTVVVMANAIDQRPRGVPPTGFWLMTDPAGTVELDAVVTAPTTKPAPVIALAASACVKPATAGAATGAENPRPPRRDPSA